MVTIDISTTQEQTVYLEQREVYQISSVLNVQNIDDISNVYWSLKEFSSTNKGTFLKPGDERVFNGVKTVYFTTPNNGAFIHVRSVL